jgi:hypothetical protein
VNRIVREACRQDGIDIGVVATLSKRDVRAQCLTADR